jgi:hypothetical protein
MTCYASLALIREGFPHSEELLQLIRGGKQLANIASDALAPAIGYRNHLFAERIVEIGRELRKQVTGIQVAELKGEPPVCIHLEELAAIVNSK